MGAGGETVRILCALHVCPLRRRRHCVRTPPLPQLLLASSLRVWFARLLCSTCEEGIGLVGLACFSSVALCFRAQIYCPKWMEVLLHLLTGNISTV